MLNKNQSKKWNSWKYALVIPVLIGFVFLFQIKVIAQEKISVNSTEKTTSSQKVIVVIDKNSTDASLKQDAINLKENHGISLTISKVKRNEKGEITGIKVSFKDEEGNHGVNQVNTDEPIQPITFVKNIDEIGKTRIGFFTPNQIDKEVIITNTNGEDVIAIQNPVSTTTNVTISKPIVYENGVRTDKNVNDIDEDTIESIEVLKGESTKKYEENAKNGIILINTKKSIAVPNPPNPPNPPAVPNLIIKSPKIPKAPKAPTGTPTENKVAWKNYEKQMAAYELQVEKMLPKMENYEVNMKVYEEKMKVYEEQMKVYEEKIKAYE